MHFCLVILFAMLFNTQELYAKSFIIEGTAEITDGDTLVVDKHKLRLEGIDAPELNQSCGIIRCGEIAKQKLVNLTKNKRLKCRIFKRDNYNRLIATCYSKNRNLNSEMVKSGNAWAFRKYSKNYVREEDHARLNEIGIWRDRNTIPAWLYRKQQWYNSSNNNRVCPIKGNISRSGKKIYHMPWDQSYSRTRIDESKGERWFCSETDALNAGWRSAFN